MPVFRVQVDETLPGAFITGLAAQHTQAPVGKRKFSLVKADPWSNRKMKAHAPFPILLALSACATVPSASPPLPEGSVVALGQPVATAGIVLTPLEVTEDSRCPMNARCVWAGRITVETRIEGAGWSETVQMTLGEPEGVRGYILNLVTAEPNRMTNDPPTPPANYRFAYEGWPPDRPPD